MPLYLTRWVISFMQNRTLSFCFDNCSEPPQPYNSGLPQGSPASPVLFLIYAQVLLEAPDNSKEKDISYLDDDGALQLSTSPSLAVDHLQDRMERRLERGVPLNLPYDLGKSGLIHFWTQRNKHKPKDTSSQPPITINGTVIKPSKVIKHLGMHLDDSLSLHPQTDEAAANGNKCLMILASLRHNYRGLSTYTALHLVHAALLPKMLWASPVWWTGSHHILHRLEPVYHRALCWASGLSAYVAIRKLLQLTCMPLLGCILNLLSAHYAIQLLFASEAHPLQHYINLPSRTLQQPWLDSKSPQTTGTRYPSLNHPLALISKYLKAGEILEDTNIPGPKPPPTFSITLVPVEDSSDGPKKHQEYLENLISGKVLLYTDGSKSEEGVCGSAWSIFTQYGMQTSSEMASGSCCIGGKAEVFDAKLHAIQEGLQHICSQNWQPRDIVVYVDNQAALTTLLSGNPAGTEFAQHTLELISTLQHAGWKIQGLWTPAHCEIPGNEQADKLAKLGSRKTNICSHARVTKTWLQAKVKEQLLQDWANQYPPDPSFPITITTKFPKDLQRLSPATSRALF